jgi:hypothetical protein
MNYIRHLNAFFSLIRSDNRLTSSHVSLYLALFQYWNFNRFQNPFPVYRENMMQLSKIGSKNTYHKCIKELHQAQYILYHPAVSKYQPVKISMIRLDTKEQESGCSQLDLFSPNNRTRQVSNLTDTSTNIGTAQVPNSGHSIKPNINKQRETPAHEIFKRNKKIQNAINDMAGVPNLGQVPTLQEVQNYFAEKKYPAEEAIKFFNHYKALHWKLQGKTPILDWKPLVEKWMQNAKKWEDKKHQPASDSVKDIQYLYDSFLEGKKIFQYILPDHFDQLKLELTNEIRQQAWQQRINQVSGTNQHTMDKLWQAYLTSDLSNELVKNDQPNFIALAKRLAVINHFYNLKNQSQ